MTQEMKSVIAGKNLKKFISKAGYSQERFAYEVGVDPRSLRRYLKNGINDVDLLDKMSRILEVDFGEFFK